VTGASLKENRQPGRRGYTLTACRSSTPLLPGRSLPALHTTFESANFESGKLCGIRHVCLSSSTFPPGSRPKWGCTSALGALIRRTSRASPRQDRQLSRGSSSVRVLGVGVAQWLAGARGAGCSSAPLANAALSSGAASHRQPLRASCARVETSPTSRPPKSTEHLHPDELIMNTRRFARLTPLRVGPVACSEITCGTAWQQSPRPFWKRQVPGRRQRALSRHRHSMRGPALRLPQAWPRFSLAA